MPVTLPPVGAKNGEWILVRRKVLNDRKIKDTWVLDPTVILTPTKAYYGSAGNATSHPGNPGGAATEFDSARYSAIASDDSTYASESATATISGRYCWVAHRFQFDLTQYNTGGKKVTGLTYKWDGYRQGGYIAYHSYHKETTGWVQDAALPTSDGAGFEVTRTIANVPNSIINNIFEFGAYVVDQCIEAAVSVYIYTDYVELEVTYEIDILEEGSGEDQISAIALVSIYDEGAGEDAFAPGIPVLITDEGLGEDAFTVPFQTRSFDDEGLGYDELTTPYKEIIFEDGASASDVFEKTDISLQIALSKLYQTIVSLLPFWLVGGAAVGIIKAVKPKKPKIPKATPTPTRPPKPKVKTEKEEELKKAAEALKKRTRR